MRKLYKVICGVETRLAALFLTISVSVIFISAVMRTIKHPISWGLDIALLLFTWSTFLGADIAFRKEALVRVDMLTNRLPHKLRKMLEMLVYGLMMATILFMLYYGVLLTIKSSARSFQGTPWLSYSFVSSSVPVGMGLMLLTAINQIYDKFLAGKAAVPQGEVKEC